MAVSTTQSVPPSAEELAAALATPLATLPFPARMETFFERKGLRTVGELVALVPASLLVEPNLGRKSIEDARAVLRGRFRASWESLQKAAGFVGTPAPAGGGDDWDSLSRRMRDEDLGRMLTTLGLPGRMRTFVARQNMWTVRDLLSVPYAELCEARGVGRGTLQDTLATLRGLATQPLLEAPAPVSVPLSEPLAPGSRWRSLLLGALRELGSRERLVLTQRSGLAGPSQTLAEIGECFGVSRERIRQLEARSLERLRAERWVEPMTRRLDAAARAPVVRLDAWKPQDELFARGEADDEAFAFLVNEILRGDVRVATLDGITVLTRISRDELEERVRRARVAAKMLTYPIPCGQQQAALANALGAWIPEIEDVLPFVEDEWTVEGDQITQFGTSKRAGVISWLRANGPTPKARLEDRFGRMKLPEELVWLDHGLLALPEQIPDWDRWIVRIPPLVRAIIEGEGPDRQWTTPELLPLIEEEAETPPWLNAWTLGSLLRSTSEVRYLGRNVVALAESGTTDRQHVHGLIFRVLDEAKQPLLEDEVVARVQQTRGLGTHTWLLHRTLAPFVLFSDGRMGLSPRDIPGGECSVAAFCDEVFAKLDAGQAGMTGTDLRPFVAMRDGWDIRAARSLLRHDGRFRLSNTGAIGLAEWETVRSPSQRDLLQEMMIEFDGAVPIEIAMERMPTASGEPLTRNRLGLLANSIRARLMNAFVEWMPDEPARASTTGVVRRVVAQIPEDAGPQFTAYLGLALEDAELRAHLETWRSTMRAEAKQNPHVESEQVERLGRWADELLARRGATSDADTRALLAAAVEYLAALDDALTDTALGGLDDDEMVLKVVAKATE